MKAQDVILRFGTFIKSVRRAQWERDHHSSHPIDYQRIEDSKKALIAGIEGMNTTELLRFQRIITLGLFHVGKAENNGEMMIQAAKF